MLLLVMPIAALVATGLTIIWAIIVQWFLNKWDQEDKKCKKCGGTEFIERVVGGYKKYGGYAKDGYHLGLEKSDYETNVECEKCGNYGDDIKSVAEWEGVNEYRLK